MVIMPESRATIEKKKSKKHHGLKKKLKKKADSISNKKDVKIEEVLVKSEVEPCEEILNVEVTKKSKSKKPKLPNIAKSKLVYNVESCIKPLYSGGPILFADKGSKMICLSDGILNIIDVKTSQILSTISQLEETVTSFIYLEKSNMLITSSQNLLLRQYLLSDDSAMLTKTWKTFHRSVVQTMAYDKSETVVATGSSDCTVKVWHLVRQYCTHNFKHPVPVTLVKFGPPPKKVNDLTLLTSAQDCVIRIWDLESSTLKTTLKGHSGRVTCLLFVDNFSTLVSAGRDSLMVLWSRSSEDVYSKKSSIAVFDVVETGVVCPKEVLPDDSDRHVILAGEKHSLALWNTTQGECIAKQPMDADCPVERMIYCEQTQTLLTADQEQTIILFDTRPLNLAQRKKAFLPRKQLSGNMNEISALALLPDSSMLLVAANSSVIRLYNTQNWSCQLVPGHTDTVTSLTVSPFHKHLAFSAGKDSTIKVWSISLSQTENDLHLIASVECLQTLVGHTQDILALASANLAQKLIVSAGIDLTVKVWSASSDGNCQSGYSCVATEKAHDKDINCVAVSPNDRYLATASQDKTARIWSLPDLERVGTLKDGGHKRGLWTCAFSPTDQVVATGCVDGSVKLWSLTDFTVVKSLVGHEASVLSVSFVSHGLQLMTSGSDGLIKVWDLKTAEAVVTLDEPHEGNKIWSFCVDKPAEQSLYTSTSAGVIVKWKDDTTVEKKRQKQERNTKIVENQRLANLMFEEKYGEALSVALTLNFPGAALKALEQLSTFNQLPVLTRVVKETLDLEQKDNLLKLCSFWNTNSKYCLTAQFGINALLKALPLEEISSLPSATAAIESMVPYTQRHVARYRSMVQEMSLATFASDFLGDDDEDEK